jgi:hypothetical protein
MAGARLIGHITSAFDERFHPAGFRAREFVG